MFFKKLMILLLNLYIIAKIKISCPYFDLIYIILNNINFLKLFESIIMNKKPSTKDTFL